jgi:hypothetical protein
MIAILTIALLPNISRTRLQETMAGGVARQVDIGVETR